jgi:copper chaperone CopZ
MERAERIHGVADVKYNPRTREITVLYDAKITSSRHIRHAVA